MISLKSHRTELVNLPVTIAALDELDILIRRYDKSSDTQPSDATRVTCSFIKPGYGQMDVHFSQDIIVAALKAQRQRLVDYLEGIGITP